MTNLNKCVSVVTLPTAIPVHVNSVTSRFKGSNQCVNSTGRSGDDILIGTNGPNVLSGFEGNDTIYGLGSSSNSSRDSICGVCDDKFGGDDNDFP